MLETKMLFKIISCIFLLNIFVCKCVGECVQVDENVRNVTIKYGNATVIRFQIPDANSKFQQLQQELIRLKNILNELVEQLNNLTSLESNQFASCCAEATALTRRSGIYQIRVPVYSRHPFIVSCDEETQGGGWTTVLAREDGSVDFYQFWNDYKKGFGNVAGEFFIGLDKLHALTKTLDQELIVIMENFKGERRFAKYDRFAIAGEEDAYKLITLGTYSGDAGDSLSYHLGYKFTTRDRDNDIKPSVNCAEKFTGAWWYGDCYYSNLMGKYIDSSVERSIIWLGFTHNTSSLSRVQMMIRPRRNLYN